MCTSPWTGSKLLMEKSQSAGLKSAGQEEHCSLSLLPTSLLPFPTASCLQFPSPADLCLTVYSHFLQDQLSQRVSSPLLASYLVSFSSIRCPPFLRDEEDDVPAPLFGCFLLLLRTMSVRSTDDHSIIRCTDYYFTQHQQELNGRDSHQHQTTVWTS